jgi:hypothetical protein
MWMIQGNWQKETITKIGVEKVFDQVLPIGVKDSIVLVEEMEGRMVASGGKQR